MEARSESIGITGTSTAAFHRPKATEREKGPISPTVQALTQLGFAKVEVDTLDLAEMPDRHVFDRAFEWDQELDPEVGRRWRSHAKLVIDESGGLSRLAHSPYVQTPEYNPHDGGKQRVFKPIVDDVLSSRTLQYLISFTTGIARATVPEIFSQRGAAKLGLHMISYRPDAAGPAYASPTWLHKDDEPFVAVILCGLTPNLSGGDNIISPNDGRYRVISEAFKLQEQFEMLLLTNTQSYHAVTPMFSSDGRPARRDVLLITFEELS